MGNLRNFYEPGNHVVLASSMDLIDDRYIMYVTTKQMDTEKGKYVITLNQIEYGLYLDDIWVTWSLQG